jgi:flavin reductase (DIM6/NTAB) family NADH-FMN oxidoreductase RutF
VISGQAEDEATRDIERATRRLVAGVCVVTRGIGDACRGVTASPLCSDPPTLVICVPRCSSIFPSLARGDMFGVSALSANQTEFARKFSGRSGARDDEAFSKGGWRAAFHDVMILREAAATFACEVEDVFERHGHGVVIGRVRGAASASESGALVRWRGGYDPIGWSDEEVARAVGLTPIDGAR